MLSLNLNPRHFDSFTFILILFGELHLLVSWCVGDRCDMTCSDEDLSRSRRSSAEDREWSSTCQVLGGRVTLYAVRTVHKKTRSVSFLVEPQNQDRWFLIWASKPVTLIW
jgi:hypothetical protein